MGRFTIRFPSVTVHHYRQMYLGDLKCIHPPRYLADSANENSSFLRMIFLFGPVSCWCSRHRDQVGRLRC
jgi:hypothetical protein